MPLRRPVSPLSFETSPPSTTDIDVEDGLGSDDELDETALDARRRRVERLAEAYLQGTPLFILSASLRGPFEKGWTNPWRKNRKQEIAGNREEAELEIQETDPRKRRHVYHAQEESARSSSVSHQDSRITYSSQKKRSSVGSRDEKSKKSRQASQASLLSHPTPKRSHLWSREQSSQLNGATRPREKNDDGWLKKDRARIGFNNFDPPTSPTTQFSNRHSDKGRLEKTSPLRQSPASSLAKSQCTTTNWRNTTLFSNQRPRSSRSKDEHQSPNIRSSASKLQHVLHSENTDPVTQQSNLNASLHVISSTSQLPTFEYRLRKPFHAREQSRSPAYDPTKHPSPAKDTEKPNPPNSQKKTAPELTVAAQPPSGQTDNEEHLERTFTSARDSKTTENKSVSFPSKDQLASYTTGGNTDEKLPSAQPVPQYPSVGDNVISLHSTAVLQNDAESNGDTDGDTSPEAHFSTQAAVLLAQKSFQDGLESPEQADTTTPARRRNNSQSSNSPPHSKNITPFYRLNSPAIEGHESQAARGLPISTQCMIDAATPFTFSTGKKPKARLDISPQGTSSCKKRKKTSFRVSSPSSQDQSPLVENDARPDAESPIGTSPHIKPHETADSQSHPSESHISGFPSTLTGSTPTTGQDGQGGLVEAENFNLSQAIADAGSWLQESFDFNKEMLHGSKSKSGPSSSAGAWCSALSLDAV